MERPAAALVAAALTCAAPGLARAQASSDDIAQIRQQLQQMKKDYETRIEALEKRLAEAEAKAGRAQQEASAASEQASQARGAATAASQQSRASAFNPAISLILQGRYANLSQDPATYRIGGFVPNGGEVDPGRRGFSLSETELWISANADPYFSGTLTAALTPENEVEVENAYFQTLALPYGLRLKGGASSPASAI